MMRKENFRNIAIIAHVDHGKTTLVDGMLKQSGTFKAHQDVEDRVMDSMDLEKERGITITAKNTAINYNNIKINIMDTPGHADFGGEVERSLNLVDGALLLVDSSEGPLPQTRFVLKKALEKDLPIILIINKIDRADSRIEEVVNEVYDLFIDLDATDEQIEFPILYTIAKDGVAHLEIEDGSTDLEPLFDTILTKIPGPIASDDYTTQFLVTNLDYDSYVGQVAIGRLNNGTLKMTETYALCGADGITRNHKLSALYTFKGLNKIKVETLEAGDIIAIAGLDGITIGDTISDNENPDPMPRIKVDEPTVSMLFYINNSPFAGKEGKYLTTRHIQDRLKKEILSNVSLQVLETERTDVFEVRGRGELQMAVLIETMRREGYEFMVSKPQVITHEENGKTMEPMEKVFFDIPEDKVGILTEKLSERKGRMTNLQNHGSGRVNMEFSIPSRGLIGFRSQFMTDTQGAGIMNKLFDGFAPWFGRIPQRNSGALVADRNGRVTAYACFGMVDRGELFIPVGTEVYDGMIIGVRNRTEDLNVNIVREKKLTNMRASGSDATVTLRPPKQLSLDQSIEFIAEDELVEVTPLSIRLRKMELNPSKRASLRKKEKYADV
ncbi:MAG: translational GTPase TypA [Candidatus Marinimicrobia bacterium]|nr:translational GTPase TypA [Candidatus Neomarinimicrobiota bacterium]MBT4154780.1 translational GTPase TypA [Candidatus Neomarinimicrobiota bacterium]MBT4554217.1 translational GTPase TypA [Candidatus Neomarinimicrobiota bacterium]MBT4753789.1 translational GTPase TypA [Candidatus Neomarinimicrobiota bacterium]MBT5116100.1 translational GTPase TypA [Candidatus Neomarinimicrobiota bacterium]